MRIFWTNQAWDDYTWWQNEDRKTLARINELIKAAYRTPREGIGKPEPLKHVFSGYYSRRINREHRLVYRMTAVDGEKVLEVISCRFHYTK